jgi:hypothetical protein
MGIHHAQVSLRSPSNLPRDHSVNVYTFSGTGSDFDGLAQAMVNAYYQKLAVALSVLGGVNRITCKIYNAQATGPNPPLATKFQDLAPVVNSGPREVAICLSTSGAPALSGRPGGLLPTERGRTFIGPINSQYCASERPGVTVRNAILELGKAIKLISVPGFLWGAGSSLNEVSRVWVDDEWDTQRRRGFRPTSRVEASV